MDKKYKHLELVQGVINRMASNSFMLKGWAVTLVVAIFALVGEDTGKLFFIVAYIPVLSFWGLDSYYLLQGRLYRALYEKVRKTKEEDIDFSLKATAEEFDSRKNCYCNCLFSKTEFWFYMPLAVSYTVIIVITYI